MNKTALGFGMGLVLIAAAVVGYLAMTGGDAAPPAPVQAEAPAERPAVREITPAEPAPAPEATSSPRNEPVPSDLVPTALTMGRLISNATEIKAGEPIEVTISIAKASGNDPVRALGIVEQIPAGFRFGDIISEKRPDLNRPVENAVEFAWFNIPEFPVEFTYRLIPGDAAPANAEISGQALYRTSGPEQRTDMLTSPLGLGAPSSTQSAPAAAPAAPVAAAAATPEAATPEAPAAPAPDSRVVAEMTTEAVPAVASDLADVVLTRAPKAAGYTPGQTVELEATIDYPGGAPLETLSLVEMLPPGWTFAAMGEGVQPAFAPQPGASGTLTFIWQEIPAFPAKISYTVTAPADATGVQKLSARAVYRNAVEQRDTAEAVAEIPAL